MNNPFPYYLGANMFNGFTGEEQATIGRFAAAFYALYGHSDFTIEEEPRGVLPRDPELNALARKLVVNEEMFDAFQQELARSIADIMDATLRPFSFTPLVVSTPSGGAWRVFGYPEGTLMLSVFPKGGFTDVDITSTQILDRWRRTRLFAVTVDGIQPARVNLDAVARANATQRH